MQELKLMDYSSALRTTGPTLGNNLSGPLLSCCKMIKLGSKTSGLNLYEFTKGSLLVFVLSDLWFLLYPPSNLLGVSPQTKGTLA